MSDEAAISRRTAGMAARAQPLFANRGGVAASPRPLTGLRPAHSGPSAPARGLSHIPTVSSVPSSQESGAPSSVEAHIASASTTALPSSAAAGHESPATIAAGLLFASVLQPHRHHGNSGSAGRAAPLTHPASSTTSGGTASERDAATAVGGSPFSSSTVSAPLEASHTAASRTVPPPTGPPTPTTPPTPIDAPAHAAVSRLAPDGPHTRPAVHEAPASFPAGLELLPRSLPVRGDVSRLSHAGHGDDAALFSSVSATTMSMSNAATAPAWEEGRRGNSISGSSIAAAAAAGSARAAGAAVVEVPSSRSRDKSGEGAAAKDFSNSSHISSVLHGPGAEGVSALIRAEAGGGLSSASAVASSLTEAGVPSMPPPSGLRDPVSLLHLVPLHLLFATPAPPAAPSSPSSAALQAEPASAYRQAFSQLRCAATPASLLTRSAAWVQQLEDEVGEATGDADAGAGEAGHGEAGGDGIAVWSSLVTHVTADLHHDHTEEELFTDGLGDDAADGKARGCSGAARGAASFVPLQYLADQSVLMMTDEAGDGASSASTGLPAFPVVPAIVFAAAVAYTPDLPRFLLVSRTHVYLCEPDGRVAYCVPVHGVRQVVRCAGDFLVWRLIPETVMTSMTAAASAQSPLSTLGTRRLLPTSTSTSSLPDRASAPPSAVPGVAEKEAITEWAIRITDVGPMAAHLRPTPSPHSSRGGATGTSGGARGRSASPLRIAVPAMPSAASPDAEAMRAEATLYLLNVLCVLRTLPSLLVSSWAGGDTAATVSEFVPAAAATSLAGARHHHRGRRGTGNRLDTMHVAGIRLPRIPLLLEGPPGRQTAVKFIEAFPTTPFDRLPAMRRPPPSSHGGGAATAAGSPVGGAGLGGHSSASSASLDGLATASPFAVADSARSVAWPGECEGPVRWASASLAAPDLVSIPVLPLSACMAAEERMEEALAHTTTAIAQTEAPLGSRAGPAGTTARLTAAESSSTAAARSASPPPLRLRDLSTAAAQQAARAALSPEAFRLALKLLGHPAPSSSEGSAISPSSSSGSPPASALPARDGAAPMPALSSAAERALAASSVSTVTPITPVVPATPAAVPSAAVAAAAPDAGVDASLAEVNSVAHRSDARSAEALAAAELPRLAASHSGSGSSASASASTTRHVDAGAEVHAEDQQADAAGDPVIAPGELVRVADDVTPSTAAAPFERSASPAHRSQNGEVEAATEPSKCGSAAAGDAVVLAVGQDVEGHSRTSVSAQRDFVQPRAGAGGERGQASSLSDAFEARVRHRPCADRVVLRERYIRQLLQRPLHCAGTRAGASATPTEADAARLADDLRRQRAIAELMCHQRSDLATAAAPAAVSPPRDGGACAADGAQRDDEEGRHGFGAAAFHTRVHATHVQGAAPPTPDAVRRRATSSTSLLAAADAEPVYAAVLRERAWRNAHA